MNGRRRRRLLATLEPMLESDERVEVTTIVNLKSVSLGRAAAVAAVSAALSSGMAVAPSPVPMYLAMTDRRLFIFEADPTFAKPKELLVTLRRAGLVRSRIRERVINSSFVITIPGEEQGLRILFPLFGRKERDVVAAAIPEEG
ncbi:hypothetical protein ACWFMI_07350 [Nocardiopsis terrae]